MPTVVSLSIDLPLWVTDLLEGFADITYGRLTSLLTVVCGRRTVTSRSHIMCEFKHVIMNFGHIAW